MAVSKAVKDHSKELSALGNWLAQQETKRQQRVHMPDPGPENIVVLWNWRKAELVCFAAPARRRC